MSLLISWLFILQKKCSFKITFSLKKVNDIIKWQSAFRHAQLKLVVFIPVSLDIGPFQQYEPLRDSVMNNVLAYQLWIFCDLGSNSVENGYSFTLKYKRRWPTTYLLVLLLSRDLCIGPFSSVAPFRPGSQFHLFNYCWLATTPPCRCAVSRRSCGTN